MYKRQVRENSSYSLIRLNMDEAVVPESFGERAIGIGGDMAKAITDIREMCIRDRFRWTSSDKNHRYDVL